MMNGSTKRAIQQARAYTGRTACEEQHPLPSEIIIDKLMLLIEWQPIQSAPKDGQLIDALTNEDKVFQRIHWGMSVRDDTVPNYPEWVTTEGQPVVPPENPHEYVTHWKPHLGILKLGDPLE